MSEVSAVALAMRVLHSSVANTAGCSARLRSVKATRRVRRSSLGAGIIAKEHAYRARLLRRWRTAKLFNLCISNRISLVKACPRLAWPTITIGRPAALDLGRQSLQLISQRPAHADGDLAVFLPSSNLLILGDLFTNGSYPVIDESSGGTL